MLPPSSLPHENLKTLFLTDSGVETTFILFQDKLELREFAAFELLNTEKGREHLRSYYRQHVVWARNEPSDDDAPRLGFVLESVTYRASPDWLHKLAILPINGKTTALSSFSS